MSYTEGLQYAIKVLEVSYELLKHKETVPPELLLDLIKDLNNELINEMDKVNTYYENERKLQ